MARLFFPLRLACVAWALGFGPLLGQSYQTSFSEVMYDRAQTPSTLHGKVEVDAPTGAASLKVPLGAGVGTRGLRYTPTLRVRSAPQALLTYGCPGARIMEIWPVPVFQTVEEELERTRCKDGTLDFWYSELSLGSMSLLPGHFDLQLDLLHILRGVVHSYELPDGEAGTLAGDLPDGVDEASANGLLAQFGYEGCSIASRPWSDDPRCVGGGKAPLVRMTSEDGLLLGLSNAGTWAERSFTYEPGLHTGMVTYHFPQGLLLIRGDLAFEFTFSHTRREASRRPELNGEQKLYFVPGHARYLLTRIANRFGEEVVFTYAEGGEGRSFPVSFKASCRRGGASAGPSVTVTFVAGIPGTPSGPEPSGDPEDPRPLYQAKRRTSGQGERFTVTYSDPSEASFIIKGGQSLTTEDTLAQADDDWFMAGPSAVIRSVDGTDQMNEPNDWLRLSWGEGERVWLKDTLSGPGLLRQVESPAQTVVLDWKAYPYIRNLLSPEWNGYKPDDRLAWFWGVTRVTEQVPEGPNRVTSHLRTVPERGQVPGGRIWMGGWVNAEFKDQVTHPDGSRVEYQFWDAQTGTSEDPPEKMLQILAHLKHLVKQTRYFAPGENAPYRVVDQGDPGSLTLARLGNPGGITNGNRGSVPRNIRSLTTTDGVVTEEERLENLDGQSFRDAGYAWKDSLLVATEAGQPPLTVKTNRAYVWRPALFQRQMLRESRSDQPSTDFLYDSLGRVTATTFNQGGNPALSLLSHYPSSPPANMPDRMEVQSAQLRLSGQVGAAYGYDQLGFLCVIQLLGAPWNLKQDHDAFGRPVTQKDPNGLATSFQWDKLGRLEFVRPPAPDEATQYTWEDRSLSSTTRRGNQENLLRFNGFGEVIWEARKAEGWTHRSFGYDSAGRRIWRSGWSAGLGSNNQWGATLAPGEKDVPAIPAWDEVRCIRWGTDGEGNPICQKSEVIHHQAVPAVSVRLATHFAYDGRGRILTTLNPNGEQTATEYDDVHLTTRVTTASGSTLFKRDALGRLVKVIASPDGIKRYETQYGYDLANRLLAVTQTDPDTGGSQIRTWTYDVLGRLQSSTQPESGTTTFSDYDVQGRAWLEDRMGLRIQRSFDTLGRILSVASAPNGGLDQAYVYDSTEQGGVGLGRLCSDRDGKIVRNYLYDSAWNGRLGALVTRIPGLPDFSQTFKYDSYGHRTATSMDGREVLTPPDTARGMPQAVQLGPQTLATASYDADTWMLAGLGLGAPGAKTTFGYDSDQVRLKTMTHAWNGGSRTWSYGYDAAGRLLTTGEDSYVYDGLDRLVAARVGLGASSMDQRFTYDAFGNRLSHLPMSAPATLTGYSLDPRDPALWKYNRLPQNGTTGASYDPQGNLTQIFLKAGDASSARSMSYDALGRVVALADANRGVTEKYQYTADGLRILIEEWEGTVLVRVRVNHYNDHRQMVCQWVME